MLEFPELQEALVSRPVPLALCGHGRGRRDIGDLHPGVSQLLRDRQALVVAHRIQDHRRLAPVAAFR